MASSSSVVSSSSSSSTWNDYVDRANQDWPRAKFTYSHHINKSRGPKVEYEWRLQNKKFLILTAKLTEKDLTFPKIYRLFCSLISLLAPTWTHDSLLPMVAVPYVATPPNLGIELALSVDDLPRITKSSGFLKKAREAAETLLPDSLPVAKKQKSEE